MEGFSSIAGIFAAIFTTLFAYASASEQEKKRFKSWISSKVTTHASVAKKTLWRLAFGLAAIGCIAIVWSSVTGIHEFLVKTESIGRQEVFRLILNLFNALFYGSAAFACLLLAIKPPEKKQEKDSLLLACKQGEYITLTPTEGVSSELLASQLKSGGIRIRIDRLQTNQVQIAIEAPKDIVIKSNKT
jgi:hypothetical protein